MSVNEEPVRLTHVVVECTYSRVFEIEVTKDQLAGLRACDEEAQEEVWAKVVAALNPPDGDPPALEITNAAIWDDEGDVVFNIDY